jgi:integrase
MAFTAFTIWQVRDERGRRKYLTREERLRVLQAADFAPLEIMVLCYVLIYTGCRIAEALALTPDHIDRDNDTVTFRTLKRRRRTFRSVPVPPEVAQMFEKLTPGEDSRFFPQHRSTAWRQIKALMRTARIAGPMATSKGIRHAYGMHAAASGVPPNLIQKWMGHSSPATTAIYLDAVGNEEREFAARMWSA